MGTKTLTLCATHSHTRSTTIIKTHYTFQNFSSYPIYSQHLPQRFPIHSIIRFFQIHKRHIYQLSLFFQLLTQLSYHKNLIRTTSTLPKPTLFLTYLLLTRFYYSFYQHSTIQLSRHSSRVIICIYLDKIRTV